MSSTLRRVPYVKQSISFREDQLDSLRRIVVEDERHGNLSRYIQELVDEDLQRRTEKRSTEKEPVAA